MAINEAVDRQAPRFAAARSARVASRGLADHDHVATLCAASGAEASRNLADAVHLLCALYGRHPGLVELALPQCPAGEVREWLRKASDAFERERLYLVRLTSAVGPLPSTAGSAETQSSLSAQRHSIETLALSERRGCAIGATTALVTDWAAVRAVLARAAARTGIEVPVSSLPDGASLAAIIATVSFEPAAERAHGFGSEQLLLQNRGLFDLLEARAAARAAS